jgi:hypothetical protein
VRAEKANASEPLMTCRNALDDIETEAAKRSRDEPGGCLPTGQAVSGMEVARARLWLRCGTLEPVAPMWRPSQWRGAGLQLVAEARTPSGRNREGERSDVGHRGGPSRGSDEAR